MYGKMVTLENPLSRKRSLPLNISELDDHDQKKVKYNGLKKRTTSLIYDLCKPGNQFLEKSSHELEHYKNKGFLNSRYEAEIIPRIQNNIDKKQSRNHFFSGESSENYYHFQRSNEKKEAKKEEMDSMDMQYGSLFGDEKAAPCMKHFLSNWDSFVEDLHDVHDCSMEDKINYRKLMEIYQKQSVLMEIESESYETAGYQTGLLNNSGYLTPTSQKDDECSSSLKFESNSTEEQNFATKDNEASETNEQEEFIKNSPLIVDDFDDICPFENDVIEDERIRAILNAEVLPNDYIGKIPSIPEKPIGDLGRLMKKYKF